MNHAQTDVDVDTSPSTIPAQEQPLAQATPSTANQPASRANFVRLIEQREHATGDADQRQPEDTRLSFQDAPAISDEKRTNAPAQVDHRAECWYPVLGEFVLATGPPPSACHLYP